jgi:hypothetical protein
LQEWSAEQNLSRRVVGPLRRPCGSRNHDEDNQVEELLHCFGHDFRGTAVDPLFSLPPRAGCARLKRTGSAVALVMLDS